MPVLDLKVWMDENFIVKFKFFEKSMASRVTIMKDSALTWTSKKIMLAGEVARRLLNTSPDLVMLGEAENDIDFFMYKLMRSGYSVHERRIIEDEGRRRYKNIVSKCDEGERVMYRCASENKLGRTVDRALKQNRWWGKNYDSVLFVQATPGEVLKKAIQSICDQSGMKLKVVEKGGKTVKSVLQKSNIEVAGECGREDCFVWHHDRRGLCSKEGVGYMIWCEVCEDDQGLRPARMHGESGRCARVRVGEHMEALFSGKSSNLREHCEQVHGGEIVPFASKVTRVFKDPLKRQLEEAYRIRNEPGVSLNDKNEWMRPAGVRVLAEAM